VYRLAVRRHLGPTDGPIDYTCVQCRGSSREAKEDQEPAVTIQPLNGPEPVFQPGRDRKTAPDGARSTTSAGQCSRRWSGLACGLPSAAIACGPSALSGLSRRTGLNREPIRTQPVGHGAERVASIPGRPYTRMPGGSFDPSTGPYLCPLRASSGGQAWPSSFPIVHESL
jgi:hypothetical protein